MAIFCSIHAVCNTSIATLFKITGNQPVFLARKSPEMCFCKPYKYLHFHLTNNWCNMCFSSLKLHEMEMHLYQNPSVCTLRFWVPVASSAPHAARFYIAGKISMPHSKACCLPYMITSLNARPDFNELAKLPGKPCRLLLADLYRTVRALNTIRWYKANILKVQKQEKELGKERNFTTINSTWDRSRQQRKLHVQSL